MNKNNLNPNLFTGSINDQDTHTLGAMAMHVSYLTHCTRIWEAEQILKKAYEAKTTSLDIAISLIIDDNWKNVDVAMGCQHSSWEEFVHDYMGDLDHKKFAEDVEEYAANRTLPKEYKVKSKPQIKAINRVKDCNKEAVMKEAHKLSRPNPVTKVKQISGRLIEMAARKLGMLEQDIAE